MTSKDIMKQFLLSLWRDRWIDLDQDTMTFDEWFEIQYTSRLGSFEKKQLEEN